MSANERLIATLAYNLYLACLVGDPAPKVKRLFGRMTEPQIGDLVVEVSTVHRTVRGAGAMGKLVRVVEEPVCEASEWEGDEPIPTERVWFVELPDGTESKWINASFIAIPTEIDHYETPFTSDPKAFT